MRFWISHIQTDATGNARTDSTTFDWSLIDNAKAIAVAHGKKLGLSVGWNRNAPAWLWAMGAYKFAVDPADNDLNNGLFDMAIPWDPVYRTYLFNFIDAFAARYDNDPAISYICLTGIQQRVENRLVNNIDASVTVTDAVTSNVGAFGKVVSATANFTTRTGAKAIVGLTIFDNAGQNAAIVFNASTLVCDPATTTGCPAAPTNDTVI